MDKIYRRFTNLRSDYYKIAQGKQGKKSGQLTALQKRKLEHLSYLKPYYKQGQKAGKESQGTGVLGGPVQTSMDHESDEEPAEDRGHESSSSTTRKETPEKFPVLTSPSPMRKTTEKRTRDTDKEKTSHFNELMSVMKELASHLVSQQAKSANIQDRERESFIAWLHDFTSRMPRRNWREFQQRTVFLAMEFTPADSPQRNAPRPRITDTTGCFYFTCPASNGPPPSQPQALLATWTCYSPSSTGV